MLCNDLSFQHRSESFQEACWHISAPSLSHILCHSGHILMCGILKTHDSTWNNDMNIVNENKYNVPLISLPFIFGSGIIRN